MIQIDILTVTLQILSILGFMVAIRALVVQPILDIVDRRDAEVAADKSKAAALSSELAQRRGDVEKKRLEVRDQVRAYRDQLRSQSAAETNALLKEVADRADQETQAALARLNADVENARPALRQQAGVLAALIEEKLTQ